MKKIILNIALMTFSFSTIAQTVGIGTTTPAKGAVLDISSTTKGVLFPRLTSAAMHQVASSGEGLLAYCTDCTPKGYYYLSEHDSLINVTTGKSTGIKATIPPFYLAANGVTVKARKGVTVGTTGKLTVNGATATYTLVDRATLLAKRNTSGEDFSKMVTTGITDMKELFFIDDSNHSTFNQDISSWDVSSVTDMVGMFRNTTDFNQDISKWDVSKVTDMKSMFSLASAFDKDIGSWDVSKVTDMKSMFIFAQKFNQDIGRWDVSNVTDMSFMFYGASAFNRDLSSWVVGSVTNCTGFSAGTGTTSWTLTKPSFSCTP